VSSGGVDVGPGDNDSGAVLPALNGCGSTTSWGGGGGLTPPRCGRLEVSVTRNGDGFVGVPENLGFQM